MKNRLYTLFIALVATLSLNATVIPITCAEAAAAAALLEHNVPGTDSVAVTGYVTSTDGIISRGQQTFWMDDEKGETKTFEGYWCDLPQEMVTANTPLNVGDKVTISGFLMRYNNTYEMKQGDITILERAVVSENNVITYKATSKLTETTNSSNSGLHTNAFNVAIISHTFSNGTGTITFAGDVTTIGERAFCRCYGLESVTIPNSIKTIEMWAFYDCSGLKSITIPNSVTTIGADAFSGCSRLTSITIPNSVTTIGADAFYVCTGLTSVTIGNSVKTIGDCAFSCCSSLTSINVDSSNKYYVSVEGVLFNYAKNTLIQYPIGNTRTQYTIPNSVETIRREAFRKSTSLTSITIPNSIKTIEMWAFYDCSGLTSITCQATTPPTCGSDCFAKVSTSISVYVPAGSVDAYKQANQWKNFTNIQPIEEECVVASGTCGRNLTWTLTCDSVLTISGTGTMYNYTSINEGYAPWYSNRDKIKYCIIEDGVTTIGNDAFSNCYKLTSITIPNSVTTIGNYAFYNCSSLTSIIIPNSVTKIGYDAIHWCSGLTSIVVDNGNTTFDSRNNCNAIIETASNKLIFGCGTTIIPNSITEIGSSAFENCDNLTSIEIPNSVKTIGMWAFQLCDNLTSVTIPNSVTTIGNWAFDYCHSLTSITIPNSVKTIGNGAFEGCDGLVSITCLATAPPTCGSYCFDGVDKSIPLYVPRSSINAYKNANQWRDFTNIKAIEDRTDFDINNTTTIVSELEALVMVPLDAKGEVTKYSYWLYLDNAHTDLVCSMDFNATGKMSNPVIRKAPMRQLAEEGQTFDSFTFEVSGLEANTTYYYVLKAFTNTQTFVKEGSFTTQSSVTRNASSQVKKVCKHNKIYIESGDKTFDIWGNLISQ